MTAAPPSSDWPARPVFPPRRQPSASPSLIDHYLTELDRSLAGQLDPALAANGIMTPLGAVARATLVEAIGADLEAAVRDLMLSGLPRNVAEAQAVEALGPAPDLGRDLLITRRRAAIEAWQIGRDSIWWWTEPLVPVVAGVAAIFLGALAPTVSIIAGMAAERQIGTLGVALVPLVVGLFAWVAGSLPTTVGDGTRS